MIVTSISCSKKGRFDVLEGAILNKYLWWLAHRPPFSPHLFHNNPVLSDAIVGLLASIVRGVSLRFQLFGEFMFAPV